MKKSQLLNFFRVTLLLLIFSAFTTSAWGATLYLKTGGWQTDNARFSAYFFGSGTTWVSMTKVSDGVYSCEAPSGYPSVIFCRMNGGTTDNNWDNNNRWEQTGDLTVPTDGKNLYDRSNSSWSTYSGEDTGGDTGGSSVVLPTQKGACQKIVIQSKNDYGLYVFKDANSINGLTWNGSVNNKGTKVGNYYQWVIDGNDYVQIIFRNSEGKKSGDSDILYGGYNYIFDKDYTIDDNGTQKPVPTSFSEVDCGSGDDDDTGECKTLYLKPTSNWDKDGARYVAYFFKDGVGHTWMNMEKSSTCSDVYKVAVPDIDLTNVIFVRMNGKKLANTWDSKWNQTSNLTFSGSNNLYTITNIDGDGYWGSSSCTDKAECYTCKLNNFDETNLEAVKCDPNNTKIIFRETFTFTDDQVDNADKSRIEYSVSNEKYSASIPSYFAMTTPCSAIKDGGYYAMVLNPYYAGWGEVGHGDVDSDCNASGHRWFREMEGGHSPVLDSSISASKDGMLLFNCKDGTDKCIPDILYECVVNDICPNTYINFSAYITRANTNASAEKKILAEFRLLNPENNDVLAVKEVKNVELTEEWKEISAMFNSSKATKVKIQLINKAESGTGNDILLDDITFSVCSPQAQLVFSGTNSSTATIIQSQSKTLEASITNGLMRESWYIWQLSTDNVTWTNISTTPIQVVVNQAATLPVSPSKKTYYRAIVASNKSDADAIYGGHDPSACGMYAITNIATLDVTINNLELTSAITDDDICVDGVDATTLTLTVKNPRLVDVTDVEVKLENITDLIITKKSGTESYSSGKWSVGDIPAGESVSIELNITSSVSAVTSKVIQSYVSSVDGTETYDSYLKAPEESKAQSTLKLNPLPAPPTVTEYKECATTGELYLYDLVEVSDKSGLIFYEKETSVTPIDTRILKDNTEIDNDYYFTYKEEGKCVSDRGKVHVKIIPVPTASITSVASQTKCAAENYTFSISAEAKNGTGIWSVTSGAASIDNVNSASTTAKVEAGKTATLTWTVSNEKCNATAFTTLSVDKQPKVTLLDGKGSASICGKSEFTVGVSTTASSGTWSIVEGSASIQNANDKETSVTGVGAGETVKLKYTATNGTCGPVDSDVVELTNLVCNQFVLENTFASETIGKGICLNKETTLTVTITNSSMATSTNVKTDVKLPAGLTYVTHSGSGTYNKDTGLWLIPSLEKGVDKKAQLVITVKGTTAATHKVTATITEATGTPVSGMSIPVSITVHALPTAKFKESTSQVCINPKGTTEETQVEVEFTGTPDYTLKYKLGDSEYTTVPAVSSPHIIQKGISADATITLISVKDNNGCENTIADQSHEVKAIFPADITILVPDDICAGDSLTLSAPTITGNGSNVTDGKWYLGGEVYTRESRVEYDKDGAILQYIANSSCGGEVRSNKVNITVNSAPSITINADGNLPAEICAGQQYQLPSVTVTNNGSNLTSEGWYLGATKISLGEDKYSYSGGTMITLDEDNNYTFSVKEDNGKSLVYKAVNGCGETFNEFRPELDVNDCSNFIFEYFSDTTVCKDAEVVLTAKITNNSNVDLSNVILAQSWSGEQIASKDANNNEKKMFVTSGDVASEYDEGNNLWKIKTFTAQKSAILTITFSAQKSEYFSMYMTESNGVEYNNTNTDNSDDSPVIIDGDDKVELKVLEISGPVTLKPGKNYNGVCPTDEKVSLSSLVEYNATDILYFYDKYKNKLTEEPSFDTSKELSATYYIKREEKDKCISDQFTDVNLKIFKPVEASISATETTICSGTKSDVDITVDSGTPDFTIVYNNGVKDITETISGTTLNIADELSSTTTYKLISVTDAHKCEAKLDGTESVTIEVNPRPELASFEIEDTDDIICEGTSTNLKANFKGTPDFKFTLQTTKTVDGVTKTETTDYTINDSEWSMEISEAGQYKITKLLDKYCESATLTDAELTLTVEGLPELTLSATDVTLNCTTPTATITASGASTYEWSYLDQTGATQTKSGATLALQQTDPDVSSLVTEYTVYGYSKNASCKSEEAKTVKVTEDFVKPVVDIKISETADGTIPERLDCYQQNIKLEADLTNNKETIVEYIWSSGSDNNTTLINNPGTYTLQVKGENGCISDVATETIEQNIVKPEVSIESYITDPVTGNIIPTIELTCANNEITLEGTITNADQYAEDYPNGEFTYLWSDGATTSSTVAKTPLATSPMEYTLIVTSPNGCLNEVDKAKVTVTENVSAPVLNIESVYKLCPSDTLSVKALSSLLPKTAGVTYKFYDEAGVEIDDFYGVSSENPVSTYYVVGTSENGCSSEKVSFDVDFAKNVDFTLTTSQTSMLVGGNETLVTIVPNEDSEVADTYTWLSNGKDILVEGLEYSANLYLDTKFEVTATNRCDTDTQEASVEVLWPTAFTPHNGNGKNDDFAKGMHIIVFNRFYTKIFEGPDGWDGTINGTMNESEQIAVPGVYYYSVKLPNGEVKKGTVEIVNVD